MENMQTLIYVKDNIENAHYIYTNDLTEEYGFVKCYELLREKYKTKYKTKYTESLVDLRYIITKDRCDIFCDEEVILHGWVWNSKDTKRNVMYELTKIPVLIVKETKSIETMTNPNLKANACFQTDTSKDTSKDTNKDKDTSKVTNKDKVTLKKLYNCNPQPDECDFFTTVTNNFSDWFSNELEPVIENMGKLNIGNEGYAVNPFNPINNGNLFLKYNCEQNLQDVLNAELRDKLSEPNLGLRITKRKKLD
jgi:hypothetical protein